MADDVVFPIVFPDYLIAVNTKRTRIKVPDLIPYFDILPEKIDVPATKNKVPELGHAGVLFIDGAKGVTKYYEYGRYDAAAIGITRRVPIANVKILQNEIDGASLRKVLAQISRKSGQRGKISSARIPVPDQFENMLDYAEKRMRENIKRKRKPYELLSNSCVHFMRGVITAAGAEVPTMIDPRPTSYIEELREMYLPVDYKPR